MEYRNTYWPLQSHKSDQDHSRHNRGYRCSHRGCCHIARPQPRRWWAYRALHHIGWVHQPRKWPGKEKAPEEPVKDETIGPGVRRAASPTVGKLKDVDPLAELRKEILGE